MNRRGFLLGLGAAVAAPAIVPYFNLMPVPRAPYVQTRSGLWVQVLNKVTGRTQVFPATKVDLARYDGEPPTAWVEFTLDESSRGYSALLTFDKFTIGKDDHELFHSSIANYDNVVSERTMMQGDSMRIGVSLR